MKQVTIILDSGVLPDVMNVLEQLDIGQWTRISNVKGAGRRTIREGTPIWPGLNEVLILAVPTELVQPLIERCHAVRDSFPLPPGMRFIVTDCELY